MFQFPWYASTQPMYSVMSNWKLPQLGFPIRTPPDQSLLTAPRGSFVVRHVLHRLLAPRHPPCALSSLTSCSGFDCSLPLFCLRKAKSRSHSIPSYVQSTVFIETCLTQVQLKRNVLIRVCFVSISSFQRTSSMQKQAV